jgi:predicted AAA+ superfamily ATPase
LIEVSYSPKIDPRSFKKIKRLGGGIILTKDKFELINESNILIIPVAYFLAGLE